MKKLKDCALLLLIGICVLQCQIGVCYRNEIEITPAPPEDTTTQKSGFFSGIKNFFRGSPTTTTTTTTPKPFIQTANQNRPTLVISQAPLMPIGPRPDTPLSSPFGGQPQQPPQWPQVGISRTTTTTTVRPSTPVLLQQPLMPNFPAQRAPGQSANSPPGLNSYRPDKIQPSGFDLSYGGGNAANRPSQGGNRPGLAPLSTPSTTAKPSPPQQPNMDIDLRFGSSKTTTRRPSQVKEEYPALPPPRRPSIGAGDEFPALPGNKSPNPAPNSPLRPSLPSAWNLTPTPPRTAALTPSFPIPNPPASPVPQGGNRVSFIPSNGISTTARPGARNSLATDDEIRQLAESLYNKEVNSQLSLIQVNVQGKTRSIDSGDEAPNSLLSVDERAFQTPTIAKMRLLFNNYEQDTLVNEHVTANERKEENDFIDAVMATSVMRQAMLFLQSKGIVTPDPKTHRDLIKELWFTQYSRGSGKIGSSGFEHVFVSEVKNGTIIGLHNWVYFYEEEKAGHLDYKGYLKQLDLGTKAKVLKARFTHNGLNKPVNTLFIGTSPELELALYTVCHQLRADSSCPVSLGSSRFGIVTYSWRYRGKNLIGSAYPDI